MTIDADELLRRLSPSARAEVRRQLGDQATPKRNKYGAEAITVDGVRYPSRREATFHASCRLLHEAGEIPWWCEQPRFLLPGPAYYYPDFLVLTAPLCTECAGKLRVIDTKGVATKAYRLKKRQVRDLYGIEIVEPEGDAPTP
ncbi:MAG: DUF1064 domain-containing protein [Phycisphaerae bacterium]